MSLRRTTQPARSWAVHLSAILIVTTLLTAALPVPAHSQPDEASAPEILQVPAGPEPDGTPVTLDVAIYHPQTDDGTASPAVLLAHGFGGSRADMEAEARDLAAAGLVVLTWTARGFGDSGGRIHLDDPDYEVADAQLLIDLLAERDDVLADAPGDPRVAVTGGSYGGALALMLAAMDPRIDAVAGLFTWHDLGTALFPQRAMSADAPGPLKQQWISRFFLSAVAQGAEAEPPAPPPCGRFDPDVCRLLLTAAEDGHPSEELMSLLRRHSPAELLPDLHVPTLLVQGMRDSLFGLEQSDATARALLAQGTPVTVRWSDGGHDGPASDESADTDLVRRWLRVQLGVGEGSDEIPAFSWAAPRAFGSDGPAEWFHADRYPTGDNAVRLTAVPFQQSPAGTILTPPGGQPASITQNPGLADGSASEQFASYPLAALPGQSVAFDTEPIAEPVAAVGAPRIRLTVTSTGPEVTFFVTFWQVNDTSAAQPRPLVAPVRLQVNPGEPTTVTVRLPMATWQLDQGTTWRVLITSTDAAFSNPTAARADRVELADHSLEIPSVAGEPSATTAGVDAELIGLSVACAVVVAAIVAAAAWRHRTRVQLAPRAELSEVPLAVERLTKAYPDGHRAVTEVSWRAEPGQVVGLLGPNGAGKTTTLRMVLGLIRPDAGGTWVRGEPVTPGAPVLRHIGALVEGPGFLPHLTGRQNLEAYWAATGRPAADAGFDEALDVAALSDAVDRPVRSYSQGMRQRLGIAQAMLGRPDVLILDEPTNGLDPPQIAAMRPILQSYADSGRTVVISSHLLSEVEQTCTHVVVMDGGRVIASGAVAELLDGQRHLEELFLDLIAGSGVHDDGEADGLADRLRQVRPR